MDESWHNPEAAKGDEKLIVSFGLHPRADKDASAEAGRPIFQDTEYIEIRIPGNKRNVVHRPVRPGDAQRFPRQYAAFKAGEAAPASGTPLTEWPPASPAQVKELNYHGIRTVEHLANMSDGNSATVGPYLALREKAKDWLKKAQGMAVESQLRSELKSRDAQIEALRKQMEDLGSKFEASKQVTPKAKGQ